MSGLRVGQRVDVICRDANTLGTVVDVRADGRFVVKHDAPLYGTVFCERYYADELRPLLWKCPTCSANSYRDVYRECDACGVRQ